MLKAVFTERHRGPRLEHVLTSCLTALYEQNDRPTFSDLYSLMYAFRSEEELAEKLRELAWGREL
jgi:hypothetical protein